MGGLFFALELPPVVRAGIVATQHGIEGTRWTPAERLHLTLHFLGEVAPEIRADLIREIKTSVLNPADVSVEGVVAFPGNQRPRLVAAAVVPSGSLDELHHALGITLSNLGLPLDARPYRPHITIARLRDADSEKVAAWRDAHTGLRAKWRAHSLTLFESISQGGTLRYLPLARIDLNHSDS